MRPSSIFSFETLRASGYRPWGLAIAVLLALGLELGVARQPRAWTWVENSPTGLVAVQDRVADRMRAPRIVVLGNSRMIDAVVPRQLDRELGLPAGSTYNLGVQAGRPFDFLSFYRRNRERLTGLEWVIVGLDDNMFSQRMDSAEQRFRFLADLDQRWRYVGSQRLSFVAGGILRSLDAGGPMWSQLRAALRGRPAVELGDDLRIVWTEPRATGPPEVARSELDRIVNRNYSRYEFTASQVEFLNELVAECRAAGIRVLLVRPPVRDAYADRVLALEPRRFREANAAYDLLEAEPLLYWRSSELAMRPESFLDYGHFALSGGDRFTRVVAEEIAGLSARPQRAGAAP